MLKYGASTKFVELLLGEGEKVKQDCRVCGGDGYVAEPYNDTKDTGPPTTVCPECKGEGRVKV